MQSEGEEGTHSTHNAAGGDTYSKEVEKMSRKLEDMEKGSKISNVIITGLTEVKPEQRERIVEWFKEKLDITITPKKVWKVGEDKIGMMCDKIEEKEEIMRKNVR